MLAVKIPTDTMRKAMPPTNNQAPVLLARSSSVIPAIPRTDVSMVKRNDMFAKASVVRRTVLKTMSPSRFGMAIMPPTIQQPLMKSNTSPVRRKRSKETCDPSIQTEYARGGYKSLGRPSALCQKGWKDLPAVLLPNGTPLGLELVWDKIDKTGFTMLCETDRPREF